MSNRFASFLRWVIVFSIVLLMVPLKSSSLPMNADETVGLPAIEPCSTLNVTALDVITFDVFGALMLTEQSMMKNLAAILPNLSSSDVTSFTSQWLGAYVSFFGKTFSSSMTHQPFQWVIRTSLLNILKSFGLSNQIPEKSQKFDALLSIWGDLRPRPHTTDVLMKLSKRYRLGLLSNGDSDTLKSALRAFPSSVNVSLIFSSDYPVNCFKPCAQMYAQSLNAVRGDKTKVLHIAGSAFDARGARTYGIYAGALDPSALNTNPKACFAFDDIQQLIPFFNL